MRSDEAPASEAEQRAVRGHDDGDARQSDATGDGRSSEGGAVGRAGCETRLRGGSLIGRRGGLAASLQDAPLERGSIGSEARFLEQQRRPSVVGLLGQQTGFSGHYQEMQRRPSQPQVTALFGPPVAALPAQFANAGSILLPANSVASNPYYLPIAGVQPMYSFATNPAHGLVPNLSDPRLYALPTMHWTGDRMPNPPITSASIGHLVVDDGRSSMAAAEAAGGLAHRSRFQSTHPLVQAEMQHPHFSHVAPPFLAVSSAAPYNSWIAAPIPYQPLHQPNVRRAWNMDATHAQILHGATMPAGTLPAAFRQPESVGGGASIPSNRVSSTATASRSLDDDLQDAAEEASSRAGGESTHASGSTPANPLAARPEQAEQAPVLSKPRRPLSAYNLYFKDERLRLVGERQGSKTSKKSSSGRRAAKGTAGVGFAQMARAISATWKQLDPETRAKYDALAAVELQRYHERKQVYIRSQQAALEAHRAMMEATVDESVRQAYFQGYAASSPSHGGEQGGARHRPAPP
jgi:HMG-box domain